MNESQACPNESVPRLRDLLTPWSRFRYLAWRGLGWPARLTVQLIKGPRLVLRAPRHTRSSGADDPGLAHEIFAWRCYRSPRSWPEPVTRIVDVGANVGYATAWFKSLWPTAKVLAIEPLPAHVEMIRLNAEANGWTQDVQVVAAAAGVTTGTLRFRERGPMSGAADSNPSANSLTLPMVDFFETVSADPIGLLKMDIEGGEYAILGDPRFARLPIQTLVMEWHNTPEQPNSRDWCRQRLLSAGFADVIDGVAAGDTGILWAFR